MNEFADGFYEIVKKMRLAQKQYVKMRDGQSLTLAKKWEKTVDDAIERKESGEDFQLPLFGEQKGGAG